jgi:hypothetical protein
MGVVDQVDRRRRRRHYRRRNLTRKVDGVSELRQGKRTDK